MFRSSMLVATVLFCAGCYHGQRLATFPSAYTPAGIFSDLRLRETRVQGELLEVHDSALVVVTPEAKVTLVYFDDIRSWRFGQKGGALIGEGGDVPVARLRTFSRYPAGMTPDVRARLLSAYGQTEIEVVR